jgi:hypothetical protein
MSRSQFQSKIFILRHAWLNLWDERMTTGRINQVAIVPESQKTYWSLLPLISRCTVRNKKLLTKRRDGQSRNLINSQLGKTNLCIKRQITQARTPQSASRQNPTWRNSRKHCTRPQPAYIAWSLSLAPYTRSLLGSCYRDANAKQQQRAEPSRFYCTDSHSETANQQTR